MLLANVLQPKIRVFSSQYDNLAMCGSITFDPQNYVPEDQPPIDILRLDVGEGRYQCICVLEDSANNNGHDDVIDLSEINMVESTQLATASVSLVSTTNNVDHDQDRKATSEEPKVMEDLIENIVNDTLVDTLKALANPTRICSSFVQSLNKAS